MFKKWMKSQNGGMALNMGICLSVLALGAGVALDMGRSNKTKTNVQDAIDTAVLATATANGSNSERIAIGTDAFWANFHGAGGVSSSGPDLQIIGGTRVTGHANANVDTTLMSLFGKSEVLVDGYAEANLSSSSGKTEVVFALDYSSSMNDQYEEMRDAMVSLVNALTDNGISNDVKIGIVPYAKQVYMSIPGQYSVSGSPGFMWDNCTVDRAWPWTATDDAASAGVMASKFGLLSREDIPDANEYDDECQPYVDNNLFTSDLSTNHAATKNLVEAMTPHSGTNVALGMQVAFQVISPNPPFTVASNYGSDWNKVIVLMSDGKHNKKGHGPSDEWSEDQGKDNIKTTCDNAKAKGILVIAVAYEIDDDEGKEDLQECASSSQYYLETEEENVVDIFTSMTDLITGTGEVRLTR